jgi:hypothetical protein
MKIYRIKTDSNNVQAVQPVNENLSKMDYLKFDGEQRKTNWETLEVYIYNPKTKPNDFYNMGWEVLIFNEKVLDICQTIFEMAGEILPLQVERGQKLYLLNILDCRNALDYDRTVWDYYNDGTRGRILEYKFHEWRIVNESTLFKIPETCATSMFCFTDNRNEDDQFYHLYHKHKLTGLIFEELFNDGESYEL